MPFVTPGNRHGRAFPQVPSDAQLPREAKRRGRASSAIGEFAAEERGGKFSASQSIENSENAEGISPRGRLVRHTRRYGPAPARKWRRKGLKRLNPRPEMVVSRKPRTHK